jgi:hypothetical protein
MLPFQSVEALVHHSLLFLQGALRMTFPAWSKKARSYLTPSVILKK